MDGRCEKGLVTTTRTFTSESKLEAIPDGAVPIDLIDGYSFCTLLKDLELGVIVERVEKGSVRRDRYATILSM